jgi:hypothetical protein
MCKHSSAQTKQFLRIAASLSRDTWFDSQAGFSIQHWQARRSVESCCLQRKESSPDPRNPYSWRSALNIYMWKWGMTQQTTQHVTPNFSTLYLISAKRYVDSDYRIERICTEVAMACRKVSTKQFLDNWRRITKNLKLASLRAEIWGRHVQNMIMGHPLFKRNIS